MNMLIFIIINIVYKHQQQRLLSQSLCNRRFTVKYPLGHFYPNFYLQNLLRNFRDGFLNQTSTKTHQTLYRNVDLLVLHIIILFILLLLHTCSLGASTLTCINLLMLIYAPHDEELIFMYREGLKPQIKTFL